MPLHPTVLWAQRADVVYLTVEISDIKVKQRWKGKSTKEICLLNPIVQ